MNEVDEATEKLVEVVLASQEYQEYRTQLEKVKQFPELKKKVDEFRQHNYALQSSPDYAFDKMEEFEREYRDFLEDPLVASFLDAELALCRMMQHISYRVVEAVDFE